MDNHDPVRRTLAAVCGRYCATCAAFQAHTCFGCAYQLGRTGRGECALFECCAVQRGLEHCGLCADFPCQLFLGHASAQEVARLYKALCRRVEIGTDAWLDEQEAR